MLNESNFQFLALAWIAIAILLVPIQLRIAAPYGRHARHDWGWTINNRLGWILMEIVSPLCFAYFFLTGSNDKSSPMWIFFGLWMLHYLNRSLIFPFKIKTKGKRMPVIIVLSAAFFNTINGFLNGYWLGNLSAIYPESWLLDRRFIIGILMFITGFILNIHSDNILIHLRKPGETDYKIPTGGLFKYLSCPNHFGEILEWCGFALLCWNLPALSFAIWTAANLIPRALAHHHWYRTKFQNYPSERQAVIPFVL